MNPINAIKKYVQWLKSKLGTRVAEPEEVLYEYKIEENKVEDDKPLLEGLDTYEQIKEVENVRFVTEYRPDRKTMVVVDDNKGAASFITDDVIDGMGLDINIIMFTGYQAGFLVEEVVNKLGIVVDHAILDITLGGRRRINGINIVYDGVDVFNILYKINNKLTYIFYTSNNMNRQLKVIDNIMIKYESITGDDMKKHILYKAGAVTFNEIRKIRTKLFGEER